MRKEQTMSDLTELFSALTSLILFLVLLAVYLFLSAAPVIVVYLLYVLFFK